MRALSLGVLAQVTCLKTEIGSFDTSRFGTTELMQWNCTTISITSNIVWAWTGKHLGRKFRRSLSQVREIIYASTKSSCMETTGNPRDPNGMKYSSQAKSILAKLTIRMVEQLLPLPIQFRIHLVRKRSFSASNFTPRGFARTPTLFVASREKYVV